MIVYVMLFMELGGFGGHYQVFEVDATKVGANYG